MKKISILTLSAALTALSLNAAPTLTDVAFAADALPGTLRVSYTLSGESAIVTARLKVDGAYAADAIFTDLIGDVNVEVAPGVRAFTWRALEALPEGTYDAGRLAVEVKAWPLSAPPAYMVRHFGQNGTTTAAGAVRYFETADSLPGEGGVTNDLYKTAYIVFRYVNAGGKTFQMGTAYDVTPREGLEDPRQVTLTQDFWLGVYPITQAQWANGVEGKRIGTFKDYDQAELMPATGFSYYTLGQWGPCNNWPRTYDEGFAMYKLRRSLGCVTLKPPSEAQWEFACRAGTTGSYYDENVDDIAWHSGNSDGHPHPVGLKKPNAWGFYDMLGNVWEQSDDWFCWFPGTAAVTDPTCQQKANGATYDRNTMGTCVRGGSYETGPVSCRCAVRYGSYGNEEPRKSITEWGRGQPWLGMRMMIPVSTVRGETAPTVATAAFSGDAFAAVASQSGASEPAAVDPRAWDARATEAVPFSNTLNGLKLIVR